MAALDTWSNTVTWLRKPAYEIHIASGVDGRYPVFAQSSAGRQATGSLRIERTDFATLDELTRSGASVKEWSVQGEDLFRRLFSGDIASRYHEARGAVPESGRLRILLQIDPPELDPVPWELLRDPTRRRTLAIDRGHSVARAPAFAEPRALFSRDLSLSILGIFPETSGLNASAEIAALRALDHEGSKIQVDILERQVTRASVRDALRRLRPTVVHFGGHGQHDEVGAFAWLDREDDLRDRIEADAFAELLTREPGLGVVVLASCEGGRRADSGRGRGLAGELLVLGVPGVVAMHTAVLDSRASHFVEELYSDLADSSTGDLEAAVGSARRRLREDRPQDPSFASPILFLRSESFELWPLPAPVIETQRPNVAAAPAAIASEEAPRVRHLGLYSMVAIIVAVILLGMHLTSSLAPGPDPDLAERGASGVDTPGPGSSTDSASEEPDRFEPSESEAPADQESTPSAREPAPRAVPHQENQAEESVASDLPAEAGVEMAGVEMAGIKGVDLAVGRIRPGTVAVAVVDGKSPLDPRAAEAIEKVFWDHDHAPTPIRVPADRELLATLEAHLLQAKRSADTGPFGAAYLLVGTATSVNRSRGPIKSMGIDLQVKLVESGTGLVRARTAESCIGDAGSDSEALLAAAEKCLGSILAVLEGA